MSQMSLDQLVRNRQELVRYLEEGAKPREAWTIGTEHEQFAFQKDSLKRAPYEGEHGIEALLISFQAQGWTPVLEDARLIALSKNGASITLEPGGQVELSGAKLATLHQTCAELNHHFTALKTVGETLGLRFISLGLDPKTPRKDRPWMPKGRYKIMRAYMPQKGSEGLDMMTATATVQANFDFESEADMVEKFRMGLALQPLATALFANSPFKDGTLTGYQSYRSHIWANTDPDRCGVPAFVFEDGMGFERYADYALDVPMYFVYRDGTYHDVAGQSFRDFLGGTLRGFEGTYPRLRDWMDHLTTLFPNVRLKQFLEMRGADAGNFSQTCALPAFWTGLLYDADALAEASAHVKNWTAGEVRELQAQVAKSGLQGTFQGRPILVLAKEVLAIAQRGLKRRGLLDAHGQDERQYLTYLQEIVDSGHSPADRLLEIYTHDCGGDMASFINHLAL